MTDSYGPASMQAAAPMRDGFIAVGSGPAGGIAWTSPDGSSWDRVGAAARALDEADLSAVAVGTGQIVATGTVSSLIGTTRPAIWATPTTGGASSVGTDWSLVSDPTGGTAQADGTTDVGRMAGVVATSNGFVAVGDIDQVGFVWRSPDGRTWTDRQRLPASGPMDTSQLVSTVDAILASGETFGPDGWQADTWLSVDGGTTWHESPFPRANVDTMAASQHVFWAFGWDPDPNGDDSAPHRVYRSDDGHTWQDVGEIPLGGAVAAVAIATSTQDRLIVATRGDGATGSKPSITVSSGGRTWTSDPVPGGASAANVLALVGTDHSILAVGGNGDRPSAWIAESAGAAVPAAPAILTVHPVGWCPTGSIDLPTITRMTAKDRLRCFGSRTLRFDAFLAQPTDLGGTCGCKTSPGWLSGGGLGDPAAWLIPLSAPFGRVGNLAAFARPMVHGTSPTLRWVSVTGHFDDPASTICRVRNLDGTLREPVTTSIAACRRSFVATKVVGIAAP